MHQKLLTALFACLLGVSCAMCSRPAAPSGADAGADAGAVRSYSSRGVVRGIDTGKKTITIAHEDIPGYMKAMTMPFDLRDTSLVKGVSDGDKISFTFTDEGQGRLVVQSIQIAP
jgi:protein SCO1/2